MNDSGPGVQRFHHTRLDEVPRLLNEAVQNAKRYHRDRPAFVKDAEAANRRIVWAQLRVLR